MFLFCTILYPIDTERVADPQAVNPMQDEPIFSNTSPVSGSPISEMHYRQRHLRDKSYLVTLSYTPVTRGKPRTEPRDTSLSENTGCCQSWLDLRKNIEDDTHN